MNTKQPDQVIQALTQEPFPFRVDLRTVDAGFLEELNARQGRTGRRAFLPADQEQQAINTAISWNKEDVERWLAHPDDTVFKAFVNHRKARPFLKDRPLRNRVKRRLLRELTEERVLWNSRIDAFFAALQRAQLLQQVPPGLLKAIRAWTTQTTDPWQTKRLLQCFDNATIKRIAFIHAKVVDRELVDLALEDPAIASYVGANPTLSRSHVKYIADKVLGFLREGAVDQKLSLTLSIHVLRSLVENNYRLGQKAIGELMGLAELLLDMQDGTPQPTYAWMALVLLTDLGELDQPTLLRLWHLLQAFPGYQDRLISNPALSGTDLLLLAESISSTNNRVLEALAARPETAQHAALQDLVLESRSDKVLRTLFGSLSGDPWVRNLRRLMATRPGQALRVIEQGGIPEGVHLTGEDAAALLERGGRNTRERVITMLKDSLERSRTGAPERIRAAAGAPAREEQRARSKRLQR